MSATWRVDWQLIAMQAEARLAKIESLCADAEKGYGEGIWGTDVSAAELRAILTDPPEDFQT